MRTKRTAFVDVAGERIYEGDIVQCNSNPTDLWRVCYGTYELCDEEGGYIGDITGWYIACDRRNPYYGVSPLYLDAPLLASKIAEFGMKVVEPVVLR